MIKIKIKENKNAVEAKIDGSKVTLMELAVLVKATEDMVEEAITSDLKEALLNGCLKNLKEKKLR